MVDSDVESPGQCGWRAGRDGPCAGGLHLDAWPWFWRRTRTGKDSEENATKLDFTVLPAYLPLVSQVGLHLMLGRSSAHMWPSSRWPAEDPAVLGPGKPRGQLRGVPRGSMRGFPVPLGAAHVPQMALGSQVGRGQGGERTGGGRWGLCLRQV